MQQQQGQLYRVYKALREPYVELLNQQYSFENKEGLAGAMTNGTVSVNSLAAGVKPYV